MQHAKDMDVDVIVTRGPGGPKDVSFDLDAGGGKTNSLTFKNDNHPGVMVYFNFVDDAKNPTGLEFKPTPSNCLWVDSKSTTCPPGACVWNQFVPLSVEDPHKKGKNTQLIVYCRNMTIKSFAFTLWFLWPDGTPQPYDPIGNGSNGPRS
jgi:hypothetical protein